MRKSAFNSLLGIILMSVSFFAVANIMSTNIVSAIPLILGTNGPDNMVGTPGPESMAGLGGNDKIRANGGNDILRGNEGNDLLLGENGDDTLSGGNDTDIAMGGQGVDRIFGDSGNDTLYATDKMTFIDGFADKLVCGAGFDVAHIHTKEGDSAYSDCEKVIVH